MNGIRSARTSRRRLAAATACTLLLCGASAAAIPQAASARAAGPAMARSAHILAAIVKRAADRAGRTSSSGVVTVRCCGARVLDVYYRARPRARLPWHGTYELKLRRRGRFLESVGVSFFPTGAHWAYGGAGVAIGPRYDFTVFSPRRGRGWRVDVSDSFLGCVRAPKGGAGQCEGFSDEVSAGETQVPRRQFKALFRQALKVVAKARRHVPISGADVVAAGAASRAARVRRVAGAPG